MWPKASNCEFAIAQLTQFRHKIGFFALAVLCAALAAGGARGESKDWIVLENCRLIVNPANDGDSFHVSAGTKEYILRLLFFARRLPLVAHAANLKIGLSSRIAD